MGDVTTARINFAATEDKGASELGGAAPLVVNAVPDATGTMRRRPGLSTWSRFPSAKASGSPVVAMTAFAGYLVYVTEDRKIRALRSTGAVLDIGVDVGYKLIGGSRPCMVAGRSLLAIAGGSNIQKWDGENAHTSALTNTSGVGGDPPPSTSLCAIAQRLVAQAANNSGQFYWTGPLEDWENWNMTSTGGAGYLQASAKPDPLVWIADNTNEVFAFGAESIQVYSPAALQVDSNDPNNLLDFALQRTQNIGTRAPYSIVAYDDNFGLIDRRKRALLTDARTFKDIGQPIYQVLRDLQKVEDAWGFRLRLGRFDALVWMFPTDGFGLMWDSASGNWCEWREGETGEDAVTITSVYDWAEEGVVLAGMSDGSICKLDDSVNADLTKSIAVKIVTGFVSHGSMAQKACRSVAFQFKRTWTTLAPPAVGVVDGGPIYSVSPSGHVRISYRDDMGAFRVLVDAELSADPSPAVIVRSVGVYRTRQWKVEYTGRDQLELVSAEETFEILGV